MNQSKGILLAIELALRQRDQFAKSVAAARKTQGFAKGQMGQLEGYAADVDARWTKSGGSTPLSVELIRHHYQFMDRLQQAIVMQSTVMKNTEHQVEQAQKSLLQMEVRLAGLNHVLAKRQAVVQLGQKRREQRMTDEFAGMQHARQTVNSITGETL
jgi:flagellar FliJ protein